LLSDFVKEYFKDIGGLTFLVDLLTSVENPEVQERTFFCLGCAIERNGESIFTDSYKTFSDLGLILINWQKQSARKF
jgi:hypothetical protein